MLMVQVPIEAERLIENELVLEQYMSPASPMLAGFRVDGFTAIKPRVTHSPSPPSHHLWETRFISAPVLYIQVSALQVPTFQTYEKRDFEKNITREMCMCVCV